MNKPSRNGAQALIRAGAGLGVPAPARCSRRQHHRRHHHSPVDLGRTLFHRETTNPPRRSPNSRCPARGNDARNASASRSRTEHNGRSCAPRPNAGCSSSFRVGHCWTLPVTFLPWLSGDGDHGSGLEPPCPPGPMAAGRGHDDCVLGKPSLRLYVR
jgi:hypothetical protein